MKKITMGLASLAIVSTSVASTVACGSKRISTDRRDVDSYFLHKQSDLAATNKIKENIDQIVAAKPTLSFVTGSVSSHKLSELASTDLLLTNTNPKPLSGVRTSITLDKNIASETATAHVELSATIKVEQDGKLVDAQYAKSYDVQLSGFAPETSTTTITKVTADQIQKTIDDAVATKAPLDVIGGLLKQVALVRISDFGTKTLANGVIAEAKEINYLPSYPKGINLTVNVRPQQPVQGVVEKTYQVLIDGFLPNPTNLAVQHYDQTQVSSLPKDGVIWAGGPAYMAYVQATSYLRAFAEDLGWKSTNTAVTDATVTSIVSSLRPLENTQPKQLSESTVWLDPVGGKENIPLQTIQALNYDVTGWSYGTTKGEFVTPNGKFTTGHWGAWIDGNKPGQFILETFVGSKLLTIHSAPNAYPVFPTLSGQAKDDMLNVVYSLISNFKHLDLKLLNMAATFGLNKNYIPIVKYIHDTNFTEEQIRTEFDKFNNGAFYFPAIEVFAKGLAGLTPEVTPKIGFGASIAAGQVKNGQIPGMASASNAGEIVKWATRIEDEHGLLPYNPSSIPSPSSPIDSIY